MAVADVVKNIAHGIGWLVPGVSEEQALQTASNHRQRTALGNMLENAYRHETDPSNFDPNDKEARDRVSNLLDMQNQLQGLGPFDSPKKLFARYGEYVANHPHALMPAGSEPQGPTLAPPGPAGPGQTPGTQAIIPPMGGGAGAPAAATPPTSPVSPAAQGGAGAAAAAPFPQPEPSRITPVSGAGPGTTSGVGNTGAGEALPAFSITGTGADTTGPGMQLPTLPSRPIPRLPGGMLTDTPELAQTLDTAINARAQLTHPAVQAQAATDQALATLQGTQQFQLANAQHKLAMIKDAVGPDVWAKLPDFYKTELISSTFGVQVPGLSAMMIPRLLTPDATGAALKQQYPGPETAGLDDASHYRAEMSPMQGLIISPHALAPLVVQSPGGTMAVTSREHPEQTPTAVPGSIAPSMVGTGRQETSLTDPTGRKTESVTTTKTPPRIPPVSRTQISGPEPSETGHADVHGTPWTKPATSGSKSVPFDGTFRLNTKVRPFNPTSRLDHIVSDIARDAANWKEVTNTNDKFQVTQRMAELNLDPNNLTTSMREQATRAGQVLQHLDEIDKLIDEADKAGVLNNVAANWNRFLTQGSLSAHVPGIGMEPKKFTFSADPTVNQIFSRLETNKGFLATAVGMTHGGMKAGSSEPIIDHWEKILSANDAPTLRARLAEARNWMKGYASMRPTQEQIEQKVGASPAGGGGGAADPANVRKFLTGK